MDPCAAKGLKESAECMEIVITLVHVNLVVRCNSKFVSKYPMIMAEAAATLQESL